jgi:SAM-dependent methyltransferase
VTRQDFSRRSTATELMDTNPVSFEEFDDYLHDLERINILTLAYRPTLLWLKRAVTDFPAGRSISVLDVGSGGGGMLRRLRKWERGKNLKLDLAGVDINPWSTKSAVESTPPKMYIRFETADILAGTAPPRTDFIISSSFTHHLGDADVVRFIRRMDRYAAHGWFINDLHRHILPYFFIKYATRLLPVNHMARQDGPISVARAFAADDWRHLLAEAGIPAGRACIEWFFPFRYSVSCRKEIRHFGADTT